MIEPGGWLLRCWELHARATRAGALDALEARELAALSALAARDAPASSRRWGSPAHVAVGARFAAARVKQLARDGLVVELAARLCAGERTVVAFSDWLRGVEWVAPCVVGSVEQREPLRARLALDGPPARVRTRGAGCTRWRSPLSLAPGARPSA